MGLGVELGGAVVHGVDNPRAVVPDCGGVQDALAVGEPGQDGVILGAAGTADDTAFGERAIHDTLAALITHNLFGRFPTLTVLSIENGSEWVRPLLKKLDRAAKTCGPRDWPFGDPGERPREIFKRHIKVAPYPEDDSIDLVRLIGAGAVIAGSDYPHPEGLPEPTEFADRLLQLDAAESRLIMRDTTAALLGLR